MPRVPPRLPASQSLPGTHQQKPAFCGLLLFRLWPAWFVHGTGVSADAASHLFPAVAAMTVLWICGANVEMFIGRELRAGQAAVAIAAISILFAVLGAIVHRTGHLSPISICLLYSGAIFVAIYAQMIMLGGSGISFRRSFLALPLAFAPLLFYVG